MEGDLPDDGTVLDAFVKLLVAEPDEKDRDGLDGLVRRSLRLRGWLDSIDARIAVRAAPAGVGAGRGGAAWRMLRPLGAVRQATVAPCGTAGQA